MSADVVPIAGFHFDEEAHRYFVDGREFPSVTGILKDAGLVSYEFCTEYARERGSVVHKAIHIELSTGRLNWTTLDERLHPYVSAAKQALSDLGAEYVESERRMFSAPYCYAGTLDAVLRLPNGKLVLVDWKTGPVYQVTGLQTAAYADLYFEATGNRISHRYGCNVRHDGTYRLEQFAERSDIVTFRGALAVVQWKQKFGMEV